MSSPRVHSHRVARHRARQRRRVGALGAAAVVTFAVGAAALGGVPQVWSSASTTTTSGSSTLEQASLMPLSQQVSEAIAALDAGAGDLKNQGAKVARIKKSEALPPASGQGRRIVFSEVAQRVWLVAADDDVERTYLVSGSKFDNLNPGRYAVQSRTRFATAFDYSGSMEYFVRFATGYTAPIGFHTVPVDTAGRLEQSKQQLGTPTSSGCVRQWRDDAVALWDYASIGTKVVVIA